MGSGSRLLDFKPAAATRRRRPATARRAFWNRDRDAPGHLDDLGGRNLEMRQQDWLLCVIVDLCERDVGRSASRCSSPCLCAWSNVRPPRRPGSAAPCARSAHPHGLSPRPTSTQIRTTRLIHIVGIPDGFGDYRRGEAVACSQLYAHRELLLHKADPAPCFSIFAIMAVGRHSLARSGPEFAHRKIHSDGTSALDPAAGHRAVRSLQFRAGP